MRTRSGWSTGSSPTTSLRAEVQALAEKIAANAPLSVRAAKQTAYLTSRMGADRGVR